MPSDHPGSYPGTNWSLTVIRRVVAPYQEPESNSWNKTRPPSNRALLRPDLSRTIQPHLIFHCVVAISYD